jgi:hypothetical protein
VFVPGPHDLTAGSMHCLPRPPLLQSVTQRLRERVHRATFASNPARLRYFGTETVLFRADILQKVHCVLANYFIVLFECSTFSIGADASKLHFTAFRARNTHALASSRQDAAGSVTLVSAPTSHLSHLLVLFVSS